MKKVFLIVTCLVSVLALSAQNNKKVAVMETKINEGVSSFQSNMVRGGMETAVANAAGYEGYDRAAFDVILKEQNFQRSGVVNETQIARLGQMAGVQYVLVSEASKENEYFYILVKLLDVETGRFLKSADKLCDATAIGIKDACAQLGDQLFNGSSIANARFGDRYTETAYGVNLQLVYVEGGEFEMGCTSEQDGDCGDDEFPVLHRKINSYYIGIFEVTQSQWEKVMGTTMRQLSEDLIDGEFWTYEDFFYGEDYPVYYVSWSECREFCDRLSRQSGKTYRLPTEAEWEFAAKGGKKDRTKYSGSNTINEVAWYYENCECVIHKCGMKRPNGLGIYDMSGNVLEWCYDWYDFYSLEDAKDLMWNPQYHVARGGSVCNDEWSCRVTCRSQGYFDQKGVGDNIHVGFRVVLVP